MAGTTTRSHLPYPDLTDTPDVPRDIEALGVRLDDLLRGGGQWQVGGGGEIPVPVAPADVGLQLTPTRSGQHLVIARFDIRTATVAANHYFYGSLVIVGAGNTLQHLPGIQSLVIANDRSSVDAIGIATFADPASDGAPPAGSLVKPRMEILNGTAGGEAMLSGGGSALIMFPLGTT